MARQQAEGVRKEALKVFFESILDVRGQYGLSVEQKQKVHESLGMSEAASQKLIAASIPEGVPDAELASHAARESGWGVKTELQTRAMQAKTSSDLQFAISVADFAQISSCSPVVKRVAEMESRLRIMEEKIKGASWNSAYCDLHLSASDALGRAKDLIAKADYDSAVLELQGSLESPDLARHVQTYPRDMPMQNRWDLELWLKVAKTRRALERPKQIHTAVQELEQPRLRPTVCWSLDVTGGDGLITAVQQIFEAMGVAPSGDGLLADLCKSLIRDIDSLVQTTQYHVDAVRKVLSHLHHEVLRLTNFPEATNEEEPEPEPEPDSEEEPDTQPYAQERSIRRSVSLTQQEVAEMQSTYEKFWPKGQEHVTVSELGAIMESIPGHTRPNFDELRNIIIDDKLEVSDECKINTTQFLKICSEQLDAADREMLEVFQIFDADGDGKISATELSERMKHYSQGVLTLSDMVIDEMMREGDKHGNGYIDWTDFKAMIRRANIDCSALERTLAQVTKQWNGDSFEHQSLNALQSVVRAVTAMSRFCGYAAWAKATKFTEYTDPSTRQAINLNTTCAGSELWCLAVVRQIISSPQTNPTVSFALPSRNVMCLPDQPDVNAALNKLLILIEDHMDQLIKDLERRSIIRFNVAAGVAAHTKRHVSDALRHFERAAEHANESEQAELKMCLENSSIELKRQQTVKGLQVDATNALAHGNGARTAIAKCAAALRLEADSSTVEHNALARLLRLAQAWDAGDVALAQWQGDKSLHDYQEAKDHHEHIETIIPSEGYYGGMVRLGTSALEELTRCTGRAQSEIDRKQQYEQTMRLAEAELDEHRASGAQNKFGEALAIAQGTAPDFFQKFTDFQNFTTSFPGLCGPESESINAKDGISRAQEELLRQIEVKDLFCQAMAVIEKCSPSKEWESQNLDDFIELWRKQSEGVELAMDRCHEALACVLSQKGRLKSQEHTNERTSLNHMVAACARWKAGGEYMANHQGADALSQFESAMASAQSAWSCAPTVGYHGAPIRLTDDAAEVLKECIASARREIKRQDDKGKINQARQSKLEGGAANEAVEQAKLELKLAITPEEIAATQKLVQEAENSLRRQELVKDLHKEATSALKQNDPDSAVNLYRQAIAKAAPDADAGLTEATSLQHMKHISELWIEGKAALQSWNGTLAVDKFRQCREIEHLLDRIQPTKGYARSKIELGLATAELQRCEGYAQAEADRNSDFGRLIDEGNQALIEWKAEHALQCFTLADDNKHARFILTYQVAKQDVIRPENTAEREKASECISRAKTELARQKDVKRAFGTCIEHLERNAQECAVVFESSPAIERCAAAATTDALAACELAIKHSLCEEGTLRSQTGIPENVALETVKQLVTAWKSGDDRLAAWDGEGALQFYQTADAHASSAAEYMKHPTEGFFDAMRVKIELTAKAYDALQTCIAEAKTEIERKTRFDDHVKEGTEHLSKLQAVKAQKRFSLANREKMNEKESKLVTELLQHADIEKDRQSKVKDNFFHAREMLYASRDLDGLVKRRTPEQHQQYLEQHEELYASIKMRTSTAFEFLFSTEGKLESQEGKPEDLALRAFDDCVQSWKSGDEFLVARQGTQAYEAYAKAIVSAKTAQETEPTDGYSGEKIELNKDADLYLNKSLQLASSEIGRKVEYGRMIKEGDQLGDIDRAPAHLKLIDEHNVDRSWCRAEGCQFPGIAHVGMCSECVNCGQTFSPTTAVVHSVSASATYAGAYATAMSDDERDTATNNILDSCNQLETLLQTERGSYVQLSENALTDFDEYGALRFLFDEHFATQSDRSRPLGGPEKTLAALHSLAAWRNSDRGPEKRITAEHIRSQLQDAVTAIEEMHGSNDEIRAMEKQKITEESVSAGAPDLDTFAEGDEDEDSSNEDEVQFSRKPQTKLDEIVQRRNRQRKHAIGHGRVYETTANELLEQKGEVERISKELRLGVFGLQRLHGSYDFVSRQDRLLREWLIAGASKSWTLEKKGVGVGRLDGQASSKTLALHTSKLKFVTTRKVGTIFSSTKTVLFEATVCLDGGELNMVTCPTDNDRKNYREAEETYTMQFTPETQVFHVQNSTEDTRAKALNEVKGKVEITHAFKIQTDGILHIVFCASSDEERMEWCRLITRKIELIQAGARLEYLPDPVLEEPSEVTMESDCLWRSQQLASEAIARFETWQASVDHLAVHRHTDDCIAELREQVHRIHQNPNWITTAPDTAVELKSCLEILRERVQAERALREIRPADSLRVAIWGQGEDFPQLCARELIDTSSRYLVAQGRYERSSLQLARVDSGATSSDTNSQLREAQLTFHGIKDLGLYKAVTGLLGDSATRSFFDLACSSSYMLKEELRQLKVTQHKARDNNVITETDGAEAADAQGCPDTSEFERLEQLRFKQKEDFDEAVHLKTRLDNRIERFDKMHREYPSLETIQDVETKLTRARRALRETSKLINAQMTVLAEAGSDHWPEVLIRLPKVGEFKQMDFIRSDLTMDSYENVKPLQNNSRNNVYTATFDGVEVVLKQYDLTKADEITAVVHEVTQLHKLRHANIVEVNGVFDEVKRGKTNMYLQMPRYAGDLVDWLKENMPQDLRIKQRRQILLGVFRAVARVHEFNFVSVALPLFSVSPASRWCSVPLCTAYLTMA